MANNDEWLRQLAAANKRGAKLRTGRHEPFTRVISLPGDFTGAVLVGQVRLYPDAPGDPLASFTVTGPVVAGGRSKFTISLTEAQMENPAIIPAAPAGDGEVTLVYDLLLTPLGQPRGLLMGEEFVCVGGVTNV